MLNHHLFTWCEKITIFTEIDEFFTQILVFWGEKSASNYRKLPQIEEMAQKNVINSLKIRISSENLFKTVEDR